MERLKIKVGLVRASLASPLITVTLNESQAQRQMWVEFVAGSWSCSVGFPMGCPIFLLPQNQPFKF